MRDVKGLERKAAEMRGLIVKSVGKAASGHPGGSLSCADVVSALYFEVMNIRPSEPLWPDRDRFVMSKGHACPALYAALALKGFFAVEELDRLREFGSILQGHPYAGKTPGVDVSAGSLGQGLSIANGLAIGAKLDKKDYFTYCLIGDGETEEGQIWEAAMTAAHYKLDNIIALIDNNGLQIDGTIEEVIGNGKIDEKFEAFGWNTITIDGHDMNAILDAIDAAKSKKGMPTAIILKTVKGKGVSFMENQAGWHGSAPSQEQVAMALKELGE